MRQIKVKDLEQEALVVAQQESYREKELEQQVTYPATLLPLLTLMPLFTLVLSLEHHLQASASHFTCVSQLEEAQATVVTLGTELATIKTKLERAEEQVRTLSIDGQLVECAPWQVSEETIAREAAELECTALVTSSA